MHFSDVCVSYNNLLQGVEIKNFSRYRDRFIFKSHPNKVLDNQCYTIYCLTINHVRGIRGLLPSVTCLLLQVNKQIHYYYYYYFCITSLKLVTR